MLQELIRRATTGQQPDTRRIFRPSWVYQVLRDPFWIWCHYHAPPAEAVDETSRYDQMKLQRGSEYEQTWVKAHYPEAVKIEVPFGLEALQSTFQAMLEGRSAIYQPNLWDLGGEMYGKSDLLVRDDSRGSDLGQYHYRLVEIKQSRSLQDYHKVQAGIYNRMLGRIQGYIPGDMTVALRETSQQVLHASVEDEVKETLDTWRALRDGQFVPELGRPPEATSSPWRIYGNNLVESRKDLVLLAGIVARERVKLRSAEIQTLDQLWNLGLKEVQEILGPKPGAQAYYTAQSYKTGQPIPKPGCQLTVPRGKRHLYFDVETSDDIHPTESPHLYLIGCWDAEREQYLPFLARGADDEQRIVSDFLEYVGDAQDTKLYHWTEFETRQLRDVSRRWPALETSVNVLLASCVDLKEAVKSAVYLPVPTFSLKCVAPALGFRWRQETFNAFDSMVCYWDYLEGAGESMIKQVQVYNEDDCRAMWHTYHELTKRTSLS